MAKYFRWNPARSADGTYSGTVTKRFLTLDEAPNRRTEVSSYYNVDEVESSQSTLVHQDKSEGKPKKLGPIADDNLVAKISSFAAHSTKRNHCLSDWVVLRAGSTRMTIPLGGYLWKESSGTTTNVADSGSAPYSGNIQTTVGDIFWATETNSSTGRRTPLHCLRDGDTGSMVPKSLAGTQFGFASSRYDGSQIDVYALYDDTVVTWGETGQNSGGYNNSFNTSVDMDAGDIQERNWSTATSRIFISSTKDIIVSVAEAGGGDRMMVPPVSEYYYTRRTTTKGEFTTGSNATHSNNLVVYSTNTGNKVWATEIADGSGGDSTMGLGIEFLANTFTYGNSLSDYAIVAPFGETSVSVKYHDKTSGNAAAWDTLYNHTIGTSSNNPTSPAAIFVDGGSGSGANVTTNFSEFNEGGGAEYLADGAGMWWFESDKPVYIVINTPSNDEESLLGWMRRSSRSDTWLSTANDIKKYIIDPDDDLILVE